MDRELQELEASLKNLRPERLAPAYMDRLTAALEGRGAKLEPGLQQVERALAGMAPVALSADLSARCLEAAAKIPFPVDEKVVLFPGRPVVRPAAKAARRPVWHMAAAAAVVAAAGGFTATLVSGPGAARAVASATVAPSRPVEAVTVASAVVPPAMNPEQMASPAVRSNVVPASRGGAGIQEARDEGVLWNRDGNPIRMVKVRYMETVKVRGADGKETEVQRPREDYIAVPEKVD